MIHSAFSIVAVGGGGSPADAVARKLYEAKDTSQLPTGDEMRTYLEERRAERKTHETMSAARDKLESHRGVLYASVMATRLRKE